MNSFNGDTPHQRLFFTREYKHLRSRKSYSSRTPYTKFYENQPYDTSNYEQASGIHSLIYYGAARTNNPTDEPIPSEAQQVSVESIADPYNSKCRLIYLVTLSIQKKASAHTQPYYCCRNEDVEQFRFS